MEQTVKRRVIWKGPDMRQIRYGNWVCVELLGGKAYWIWVPTNVQADLSPKGEPNELSR